MPSRSSSAPEEVSAAIGRLEIPLLLGDLDDFTVRAISPAALRGMGVAPSDVIGRPILDLICEEHRAQAQEALEAMRAGTIDFYRARRRLHIDGRRGPMATVWVRAFRFGDKRVAVALAAVGSKPLRSPLDVYLGRAPVAVAIGTADAARVITSVSADIDELIGIPADEMIGRRLVGWVEPDEVSTLLDAGRLADTGASTAVRIRMRDGSGGWTPLYCVLTSLAGSMDLCFMLMPDTSSAGSGAGRAARLEEHLWKIALEVQASDIWPQIARRPDPASFPDMGGLTARQREVLRRLMRGERVPTIARAGLCPGDT